YVGTRGGGMDQTVCLCAAAGAALKISFTPFALEPVTVPEDWIFIVGHSLVVADKSLGTRERYNAIPARCNAAVRQYARLTGMSANYPYLLDSCSPSELISVAEALWPEETPELLRAFRHVVTEAVRVELAVEAMRQGKLDVFGRAMIESHVSLRDDLGVSCPDLDELVSAFLAAGAAGARVTGAGFGGCVVALCSRSHAASMMEQVEQQFYDSRKPQRAGFATYLFPVEPSPGAGLGE
ncbi:MAG: hypothetical protein ABIZ80_19350, partial [Bryobacteraceae bacterium]